MQPIQGGLTFSKLDRRRDLQRRTTSWSGPRSATYTAQYVNQPPVAVAAVTPLGGVAPLAVQFTGSGSSDPEFTTLHLQLGLRRRRQLDAGRPGAHLHQPGHLHRHAHRHRPAQRRRRPQSRHRDRDGDRTVRQRPDRSGRGLRRRPLLHRRLPVRRRRRGVPPRGGRLRRGGDLHGIQRDLPGGRPGSGRDPVPARRRVCATWRRPAPGSSPACPADGFASSGTVCRPPASPCDVAETCTGSGAACPADVKRAERHELQRRQRLQRRRDLSERHLHRGNAAGVQRRQPVHRRLPATPPPAASS